jgi:hypothetical protein
MMEAIRAACSPDRMLSPRAARQRARRSWYGRVAMVGGGLAAGIALLVYVVTRVIGTFAEGEPPALDAMAPMIPGPILDSARVSGFLAEGDTVLYLFAPHGLGLSDALYVTTRDFVTVHDGAPRRYSRGIDFKIDLRRTDKQGLLTFTHPVTGQSDTIYHSMSGVEQQVLLLALRRVLR